MPAAETPTHDKDLVELLHEALDGADQRRAVLLTALFMLDLDAERDADLDRLRREGPPPVRPF